MSNNFNRKERFMTNQNRNLINETSRLNIVDIESRLKNTNLNSKNKMQTELNTNLNPNNYTLPIINYSNKIQNTTNILTRSEEISAFQPWRRDINIDRHNDIRYGNNTRLDAKNVKIEKEANINERWDFIDNRFQRLDHIMMPIIRGGESTRKDPIPLNINNIDELETRELKFDFKY